MHSIAVISSHSTQFTFPVHDFVFIVLLFSCVSTRFCVLVHLARLFPSSLSHSFRFVSFHCLFNDLLAIVSLFFFLYAHHPSRSHCFIVSLFHCVFYGPIALTLKKKNCTIMLSILFNFSRAH